MGGPQSGDTIVLYKQTTTDVYTRARVIAIDNPLPTEGLTPSIRFNEELATSDGRSLGPSGYCSMTFAEDGSFPIINPTTGEAVGTATHQDLQVLLYSLYLHTADVRDNTPAEVGVDVEPLPLYGDDVPPNEPVPPPEGV